MPVCVNHADKTADLVCMKYQVHFCEACAHCRDPQLFCKHRTACAIWFIAKDRENGWGKMPENDGQRSEDGRESADG